MEVLRGSIFGPLLFNAYIKALPSVRDGVPSAYIRVSTQSGCDGVDSLMGSDAAVSVMCHALKHIKHNTANLSLSL